MCAQLHPGNVLHSFSVSSLQPPPSPLPLQACVHEHPLIVVQAMSSFWFEHGFGVPSHDGCSRSASFREHPSWRMQSPTASPEHEVGVPPQVPPSSQDPSSHCAIVRDVHVGALPLHVYTSSPPPPHAEASKTRPTTLMKYAAIFFIFNSQWVCAARNYSPETPTL